jgi:prepilin-type N-terminal cleavage/methylation domain-containing protein
MKFSNHGVTLVETMVAVFVALIGVFSLGNVIFEATVFNKNQGTENTRATIYAQDKLEGLLALDFANCTQSSTSQAAACNTTGLTASGWRQGLLSGGAVAPLPGGLPGERRLGGLCGLLGWGGPTHHGHQLLGHLRQHGLLHQDVAGSGRGFFGTGHETDYRGGLFSERGYCSRSEADCRTDQRCFESELAGWSNPLQNDQTIHGPHNMQRGFSLLEMLASLLIITLLMSAVFSFMLQAQKKFQGNSVAAESNHSARAALEVMTQEIGQAGFNPNFVPNKTGNVVVNANAAEQCVTLSDIAQIHPGDWLSVDVGGNNELVKVTGTSATGSCVGTNQVKGVFQVDHSATPFPVISYKMPFPSGILQGTGTSGDHTLEFFGDINADGTIQYAVYSLTPTTSPATTVTVDGATYTLYTLTRSLTPVTFVSGATSGPASPLVQNVLYNLTTGQGPTGQPIFAYPNVITVGIVPNQVTVVGTVVLTISVAENPKNIETNRVSWFTMSTQVRPLNLSAAVAVSRAGGFTYLPRQPAGLPMM